MQSISLYVVTPPDVVDWTFLPGLDTCMLGSSVASKQYFPGLHGYSLGEVLGEQTIPAGQG